jgi:hypothetical protein
MNWFQRWQLLSGGNGNLGSKNLQLERIKQVAKADFSCFKLAN